MQRNTENTADLVMDILQILVDNQNDQKSMIKDLLHLLIPLEIDVIRKDSPMYISNIFETLIASLQKIIENFQNDTQVFSPHQILESVWDVILSLFQSIITMAIIEYDNNVNQFQYVAIKKVKDCLKEWNRVDMEWQKKLQLYLIKDSFFCQNLKSYMPLLKQNTGKESLLVSFLWKKPNGQPQYLMLVREAYQTPFYSQEMHAISLFSKIIGLHMGYCYLHTALHFKPVK